MHLTPVQFQALVQDWERERKEQAGHFASLMALLANINRDPKKRRKPYEAGDFMPRERKQMSDDAMYQHMRNLFPDKKDKNK